LGEHPEGEPIIAQNGRYGPYLTWGKETRSLEDEEQIFSIDLTGALALLAQPKQRAAARPRTVEAELGEDPVTKRNVVVRTGRFGLYVTDGEVNATLRLGDTPGDHLPRSRLRVTRRTAQRRTVESSPAKRSRRQRRSREEGDQEITCEKGDRNRQAARR